MRPLIPLLIAGLTALPARAELSMGDFQVITAETFVAIGESIQAAQAKREARLSRDIDLLARDVHALSRDAGRLRRELSGLRLQRGTPGPDLGRLMVELKRWSLYPDVKLGEAKRLDRRLKPGAEIRAQATRLMWAVLELQRETVCLRTDVARAESDLRRAGHAADAMDMGRRIRAAQRAAESLRRTADSIRRKDTTRPPGPPEPRI